MHSDMEILAYKFPDQSPSPHSNADFIWRRIMTWKIKKVIQEKSRQILDFLAGSGWSPQVFFQHKKENNALLNKAQLVKTPVSDLIVKQQKMWIHTMQFLLLLIQPSWVLSQGLYQVLNQRLLISRFLLFLVFLQKIHTTWYHNYSAQW